ncbi:MAG: CbiQ family ECF transporter T component [Methylotenera sp.]|nr:CbiQ family ECF transporter T component [Methylotenera sp.]MDO9233009.1 CbiQ family ECF transporter T component [Methylotenera sp.]MDO9388551.1 CbiQ family ECF transporter T component [Methylotenera sp.]MDP1597506.1 CbiQ family ECF transporter T component [Methylotenera sp.]MDP1958231.1 CbiQ family ECF transporter T component [Methylotenera sp.]
MHPIIKILSFILTLLLMNFLSNSLLHLLFIGVCMIAMSLQMRSFTRVVMRMRWLFISILVIYGLGTPGELIPHIPLDFAPTFDGLQLGLLHIERITIALATLNILFITGSKQDIILGLYILLSPLKYVGLNIEKFAVRLFLTLEYVEDFATQRHKPFDLNNFDHLYLSTDDVSSEKIVVFNQMPFRLLDKVLIVIFMIIASICLVLGLRS